MRITQFGWIGLIMVSSAYTVASAQSLGLGGSKPPVSDGTYTFIGRQRDLPDGAYWYVVGHSESEGRDIIAARFDAQGKRWSKLKTTQAQYEADPTNDDHLIYNTPLYAPASGVVVSCWREAPENPRPVIHKDDNIPHEWRTSTPKHIFRAGNHINILTDDNRIIFFAHLKPGTIPKHLCPFTSNWVKDADNKIGDYPVESLIPPAQRPRVVQGELIGRVGNSGAASLPHVHVHQRLATGTIGGSLEVPDVGAAIPYVFHGLYASTGSAADFKPLVDQELPVGALIHASPFLHQQDRDEAAVTETVSVRVENFIATALRDAAGNLRVRSYRTSDDGSWKLVDERVRGAASQLAIARVGVFSKQFVTAMRDGHGDLKLISWDLTPWGQILLRGEADAGPVGKLALTTSPIGYGTGVVTAARDSAGMLKVMTWDVSTGAIKRVGTASGGTATELAITALTTPFVGVATAARNADGDLRIETFEMTKSLTISATPRATRAEGAISRIDAATVRPDLQSDRLVTAMRDGNGNLRLITYRIGAAGQIVRASTEVAGAITDLKLQPMARNDVATAARDAQGNLRITNWRLFGDDRIEHHGDTAVGGAAGYSLTRAFDDDQDGRSQVVASLRTLTGVHRLISWQYTH